MSFFTDFIIADPSDAPQVALAIEAEGTPVGAWSGFSVNSVNDLDLANLYALLRDGPGARGAMALAEEFTDLHRAEEGPSVQLVPPAFVGLLAALPDERRLPVAALWSEADEFGRLTDPADLKELIGQLCELARQAAGEGKSMLLCVSGV